MKGPLGTRVTPPDPAPARPPLTVPAAGTGVTSATRELPPPPTVLHGNGRRGDNTGWHIWKLLRK